MKLQITQLFCSGTPTFSWFIIFKRFQKSTGNKYQLTPVESPACSLSFNDTKCLFTGR
jgi:hypothetical protein